MGTYADDFNARYTSASGGGGLPLSSAPQLVVLSGPWDAHAQTSELMEYELLSDVVSDALGEMRRSTTAEARRAAAATAATNGRDVVYDDDNMMMMEWETALGIYNGVSPQV